MDARGMGSYKVVVKGGPRPGESKGGISGKVRGEGTILYRVIDSDRAGNKRNGV